MPKVEVAPSILSADFGRLAEVVEEVERAGADRIHLDVMDGQFVPPITMGPVVVRAVRAATDLPLEAHLMVVSPERQVESFIEAGCSMIVVHQEATAHVHRIAGEIKASGAQAGVAINPGTDPDLLRPILPNLDLILLMTVNPGYAGQRFIPGMLEKIDRVHEMIEAAGAKCQLEVDGGIGPQTAPQVVERGATVLVAASAIFQAPEGIERAIRTLRGRPR